MTFFLRALMTMAVCLGPAHAEGEQALANLFRDACVMQFPAFAGTAAVAQTAGLSPQRDGTFKGDGYLLNPAVKLSDRRSQTCLLARHEADPTETAAMLAKTLNGRSVTVENASQNGRRTTLQISVNGQPADVFIGPMMRTFTSVTISER